MLGLHYREGVTKSPLEASDELEICAADEQWANKLSSASVQRSGCFGHERRGKPRSAGGRSKQKIIL
jgi:hypothetical protein